MVTSTSNSRRLLGAALGAVPGGLLAAGAAITAGIRHTKPLHPQGTVGFGRLEIDGTAASGVPLLDEPAVHEAVVRKSRAMGLPRGMADIDGLAIRLQLESGPADVLFAGTGTGSVGRYVLMLRRPHRAGPLTTLLPLSTQQGPLMLKLEPTGDPELSAVYRLSWSRAGGAWRPVGRIVVEWGTEDRDLRFDPVLHQLPGTAQYGWVTTLREPAYRAGRAVSP